MVAAIYVLFYIYLSDIRSGSINKKRKTKTAERRVLELHDQGKGTREMTEILNMSFRDIGPILKEKEVEKEQAEHQFQSSQAYKLFSG